MELRTSQSANTVISQRAATTGLTRGQPGNREARCSASVYETGLTARAIRSGPRRLGIEEIKRGEHAVLLFWG
jgi:hypothetical protein